MTPWLEIILPAGLSGSALERTAVSICEQSDRGLAVIFSVNQSDASQEIADQAIATLSSTGISAKKIETPFQLTPIEELNWAVAQANGGWIKIVRPGEQLSPDYTIKLRQRIHKQPHAQMIRCDAQVQTEWGMETHSAPFEGNSIGRAGVWDFFPAKSEWLAGIANYAYSRVAWFAVGGLAPHLPGHCELALNLTMALHYGMDNISETLITTERRHSSRLNECSSFRVNHWMEWWLILREANNYCLANNLPFPIGWPLLRAFTASRQRW